MQMEEQLECMDMKKSNKGTDPIIPLLLAYIVTIGLTIAWEVFTNK
jgi:hypothetical protein